MRGAALQCRITTEDPANGFRPDTGRITTYRSPGGAGVRLDGGTAYVGAEIERALRLAAGQAHLPRPRAARRDPPGSPGAGRVPHPRRADQHRVPAARCSTIPTSWPAGSPPRSSRTTRACWPPRISADRGTKLLTYLADVTVNRPHGAAAAAGRPGGEAAPAPTCGSPPPGGSRQRLPRPRPAGVRAASCARQAALAVTDTTFRDAHQSLLATRVRTRDLLAVGRARRAHRPAAAVAGGLGRRHLRRRAALPARGPVGAAGRAARGGAEHLPADAAARPQHGRVHPVPGQR